ncbi:MAG: 2-oxoacid:acceptor oxidoreductase family protein, partial [Bacteroidota bacterium]
VLAPSSRADVESLGIDAQEEAHKLNKKQVANMIMLGAFLERRPLVSPENVLNALKKVLPERHHHLLPLNEEALMRGKQIALESAHESVL